MEDDGGMIGFDVGKDDRCVFLSSKLSEERSIDPMENVTRRQLVLTIGGLTVGMSTVLTGCGSEPTPAPAPAPTPSPTPTPAPAPTPSPTPQQYVSVVGTALTDVLSDIGAVIAIPPSISADLQTAETAAGAVLSAASAGTVSAWSSAVQMILTDVSGNSAIMSALPQTVQTVLSDVEELMPVAVAAFQIAGMFASRAPRRFGALRAPASDPYSDLVNYISGKAKSQVR
jgi:hypothetical protein